MRTLPRPEASAATPNGRPTSAEPLIVCENLVKIYKVADLEVVALQGLDLLVEPGELIAIVGASGSGKSTLLGLVAGLDAPTSGEILIDNIDITKLGEDALAKLRGEKIGFVFQFFHLVPSLTAFENILVPMEIAGRREAAARAKRLLEEVGLLDRGHHYPSQLSGGEQQRVAIARALSNDPPIILADEPTGNLDSTTGKLIMDLLLDVRRARQTTMMLVTHDPDLASLADSRLVLRDGRAVEHIESRIPNPESQPAAVESAR